TMSSVCAALVNGRASVAVQSGWPLTVLFTGHCARISGPERLWSVAAKVTSQGRRYETCPLNCGFQLGWVSQNASARGSLFLPLPEVRLRSSFSAHVLMRSRTQVEPPDTIVLR